LRREARSTTPWANSVEFHAFPGRRVRFLRARGTDWTNLRDEPSCQTPAPFEHPPVPGCDEQETHVRAGRAALREQPGGGEEPGVRQPVCPRTPRLDRTRAGSRNSATQEQGSEGSTWGSRPPGTTRPVRPARRPARQPLLPAFRARTT